MHRVRVTTSAIAIGVVALLSACTSSPTPPTTPSPDASVAASGDGVLRIGTVLPATGTLAALGPGQVAGVELAVRDINAAGGVLGTPVEIINRDSGDDSNDIAEQSTAALLERGVDVIVGGSSAAVADRIAAASAGQVPVLSPAAPAVDSSTAPDPSGAPAPTPTFWFSVAPTEQGAAISTALQAADASALVVIGVASDASAEATAAVVAGLAAATEAADGSILASGSVTGASDIAGVVRAAARDSSNWSDADAVVVVAATGAGELSSAVVTALLDSDAPADSLWVAGDDISTAASGAEDGALDGVRGVAISAPSQGAFAARIRASDPAVTDTSLSAPSYDAAVVAALAAVVANDDGGPSIASRVRAVTGSGVPCGSFAECLAVLETEPDIAYVGQAGRSVFDANGVATVSGAVGSFDGENRFTRVD